MARSRPPQPPPPPPLVLSGHAASLTPYYLDTPRPSPRTKRAPTPWRCPRCARWLRSAQAPGAPCSRAPLCPGRIRRRFRLCAGLLQRQGVQPWALAVVEFTLPLASVHIHKAPFPVHPGGPPPASARDARCQLGQRRTGGAGRRGDAPVVLPGPNIVGPVLPRVLALSVKLVLHPVAVVACSPYKLERSCR